VAVAAAGDPRGGGAATVRTRLVSAAGAALLFSAILPCIALAATQRGDGRKAAEVWLRRVPANTTVETYGPLVYLPRFAPPERAPYRVARLGPDPIAARNPLPGMREVQDRIADAPRRRADVIVLTEGFAQGYLADAPYPPDQGRVLPGVWRQARADGATTAFVRAAVAGTLADYRTCLVAAPSLPAWLPFPGTAPRLHVSTGQRTWLLVRREGHLCGD
jgi:hypothetical protein